MFGKLLNKREDDFTEFLTNPKEIYEKTKKRIEELEKSESDLKKENKMLEEELEEERDEAENKDKRIEKLEEDKSMLREILEKEMEEKLRIRTIEKKALLEKDFHHQLHTYIEEQNKEYRELIPLIIRETIEGLHNERANKMG